MSHPAASLRALLAPALLVGSLAGAQDVRLNAPLEQPVVGDVGDYALSPDGQWAAFLVDVEVAVNPFFALYSAPLGGRRPATRLSGPDHDIGNYISGAGFRISPDSRRVVYRSRARGTRDDLYSVPIDGRSGPVRLDTNANESVWDFTVAGRGERVVFRTVRGLYSVATAGGETPLRLDRALAGRAVVDFRVSLDGRTVVYLADEDVDEVLDLYGVPIDRSREPVRLSGPMVAGGSVLLRNELALSSDGRWVAYLADQETNNVFEVFAAPTDGSAPARKLNAPILAPLGVDLQLPALAIASGSGRVLYRADGNLHSVPIDGSTRAVALAALADFERVGPFELSPDGARVVFQVHESFLFSVRLFAARTDGSQAAFPITRGEVPLSSPVRITPDGRRALYLGYRLDLGVELYATPISGPGMRQRLSGELLVHDFALAPDGKSVLFRARTEEDGPVELYLTTGAGVPVRLNPPLVEGGSLLRSFSPAPRFSPDGAHVAYLADQEIDEAVELFALPLATPSQVEKLNEPLLRGPSESDVEGFGIAAGERVVYRIARTGSFDGRLFSVRTTGKPGLEELGPPGVNVEAFALDPSGQRVLFLAGGLFAAPVDGQGDVQRLDDLPPNGVTIETRFTPDGSRVVYEYVLTDEADPRVGLASVVSDGSASPVPLFEMPAAGGYLWRDFVLSPDGSWVVFRANALDPGTHELFSAPVDGSGPTRRISAALVPGGDVGNPDLVLDTPFAVSPDSTVVVYLADQETDGVLELYAAPIDGGGPVVELNASLAPGQRVKPDFAIAPGGARVVYRADQDTPGVDELYSVHLDGSERRELNAPLPANGDVGDAPGDRLRAFRIRPDGAEVLYLADQDTDGVQELYRVPIDASAPPVRCNGALAAGGDVVYGFAYGPDGARIVYGADQDTNDVFELYGVAASGPVAPVKLSGAMVTGGDALAPALPGETAARVELAFAADGTLAYLADQEANDVVELFAVPVDGSLAARKVNGPLVAGGDVRPGFAFDPLGRLVFRADRDTNEVVELFLGRLEQGMRAPASRARRQP